MDTLLTNYLLLTLGGSWRLNLELNKFIDLVSLSYIVVDLHLFIAQPATPAPPHCSLPVATTTPFLVIVYLSWPHSATALLADPIIIVTQWHWPGDIVYPLDIHIWHYD